MSLQELVQQLNRTNFNKLSATCNLRNMLQSTGMGDDEITELIDSAARTPSVVAHRELQRKIDMLKKAYHLYRSKHHANHQANNNRRKRNDDGIRSSSE